MKQERTVFLVIKDGKMLSKSQVVDCIKNNKIIFAAFHPATMLETVVFGAPVFGGGRHMVDYDALIDIRPVAVIDVFTDGVVKVCQVLCKKGGDCLGESILIKHSDLFMVEDAARRQCIEWGVKVFGRAYEMFLNKIGKTHQVNRNWECGDED
jgi:hypothetical protein